MGGNAEIRRDRAARVDLDRRDLGPGIDGHARRRRDARTDPGQLRVAREPDTKKFALRTRLGLTGTQRVVADAVAPALERFEKARTIPHDSGRGFVGKLLGADQIAPADFPRVEPEPVGRHVDQALHHERRGGPAHAPVWPGRRLARGHAAHSTVVDRHAVGTRHETDDLHRLEPRRPRIDRIGANVPDHVGAQSEDVAFFIHRELRIDGLVKRLAGRGKVFHTVARPLDRASKLARQRAHQDFLRIE